MRDATIDAAKEIIRLAQVTFSVAFAFDEKDKPQYVARGLETTAREIVIENLRDIRHKAEDLEKRLRREHTDELEEDGA